MSKIAHLNTNGQNNKKIRKRRLPVKKQNRQKSIKRPKIARNKITKKQKEFRYEKEHWYQKLWKKFKNMSLPLQVGTVFLGAFMVLSIFFGYVNSRMNIDYKHYEAVNNRYAPNNNYLVKKGAVSYLKEQLHVSSENEIIKKINDTQKYHGRWEEIKSQVQQCKNNKQLWAVLNPVVEAVQSGKRYRPEAIKANFKTYSMATIPVPLKFDNLIIVGYDSKNNQQIEVLNKFVKNNPAIQLLAFDTSSDGGKQAFQIPMYNFLNEGNQSKQGYSINKNAWLGVAYGFTNDNLSFHTKNLNDLENMHGIPTKSLYDPSIVNKINDPIQNTNGDIGTNNNE